MQTAAFRADCSACERSPRAFVRSAAGCGVRMGTPPAPRRLAPLDELVLTILSQNTNDTNRDRAYADLRHGLPSWEDVADAPIPVIERAIRSGGLGPTKAPRIRAVLRADPGAGHRARRSGAPPHPARCDQTGKTPWCRPGASRTQSPAASSRRMNSRTSFLMYACLGRG